MNRSWSLFVLISLSSLYFSACSSRAFEDTAASNSLKYSDNQMITQETSDEALGEQEMITRQLRIEERQFQLELESNEAVDALLQALPISVSMTDLNQNEKYMYLSDSLPMAPEKVGRIEKGDVLLFGSDCFVIFYKGFDTEYSYTRIGKIKDADALEFLENTETIKIHLE